MKYFLDMNLPIYFCMQFGDYLEEKAKSFVENKNVIVEVKEFKMADLPKNGEN